MTSRRERKNQVERTSAEEGWRPIACADVTPVRRFFDLQSGTIWRDLRGEISQVRGTLVDVGCGAQPYRTLVPKAVTYIGIDMADSLHLFGYHTPDTRYYDGEHWPIDDESADVVLATETLEHVKEPDRFLREAHRSLRVDGRLILTVPFAARWHFIPADYWRFTPSGLLHLLSAAGFTRVVVHARGNALTVACYKAMALCMRFIMPNEKSRLRSALFRLIGLALAPAFVALALIGNLSLQSEGGDDCLGYSVVAHKAKPAA
ncbi:MAG: Methyltransferase type 11 [Candidatus Eremiobacteraeota bacterium]|nr:Methyltransferase type 11 [Candidatus Eremiobacteraeota bacterium]